MFDGTDTQEPPGDPGDALQTARARLEGIQDRFIDQWGDLATMWGSQRSGGRLHGLLFVSPEPLPAAAIGERLRISHGNTSITTRQLLANGVIRRVHRPGERRAYFTSEPDPWQWVRNTVRQRMTRELLPVVQAMRALRQETRALAASAPDPLLPDLHATQNKIEVVLGFLEQLVRLTEAFLEQSMDPTAKEGSP